MGDKFSLNELFAEAAWEAKAMRNESINVCHLFCALTKIIGGFTDSSLQDQDMDPVIVRRKLRGLMGRPDYAIVPEPIPIDETLSNILDELTTKAERYDRDICEEDILLELLSNQHSNTLTEKLIYLDIDIHIIIESLSELNAFSEPNKPTMPSGILNDKSNNKEDNNIDIGMLHRAVKHLNNEFQNLSNILTCSPSMLKLKIELAQLAHYDTDILLIGETGTGKELFARAIHQASDSEGPLVPINCGAIPKDLFESELFGHRKGAFSGAVADKKGAFELANYGTLFLDEIGELPIDLQPKLLRAIEYREIRPVGSPHTMKLNLKIVFATNRNLKKEVEKGNFREDLFFRISSPCLSIPPLRDRRDDIPILFNHFFEQAVVKYNKSNIEIPKETLDSLRRYNWPGNVRELKKAVEEAVMRSESGILRSVSLPGQVEPTTPSKAAELPQTNKKEKFSDTQLFHWMKELDGQKNLVADKLGVSYRTVLRRCKKLGL